MDVEEALSTRRSIRGFRPDPVPQETLRRIFEAAQRAPSWCNIQPWRVWLTSGETTAKLTSALGAAARAGAPLGPDHPWPADYPDGYGVLRKQCGVALYGAMGIAREDKEARYEAWLRNYAAFDAPHVAMVGIDRRFGIYAALDVGCWLQSLLLAATAEGIATCSMASLASYSQVARETLAIPDTVALLFGVAIGYEDEAVPANRCVTDRDPIEANVTFV